MRAVIVLFAFFAQVISVVPCNDAQSQIRVVPQQFFLPPFLQKPGSDLPPPLVRPLEPPSLPCTSCSQSPLPQPVPLKTKTCPCCKPPTRTMALLLDRVADLMNLPKGSLSILPLCCARDVKIPPKLLAMTAPLSTLAQNAQAPKQLSPAEIVVLISLLKTPQALAQILNSGPNCPVLPNPNPNAPPLCLKPLPPNFPPPNYLPPNCPPQIPYFPPYIPNFPRAQTPDILANFPIYPLPPLCVTRRLEPVKRPVVEECIQNVPVYQNVIRHEEEQTIRNVPVVEKTLTNQEEHIVRHVPFVQRRTRPVVETRTRHVPVIRKRIRTVVEPYTSHVPVLEKFTRPVEETFITSVPVVEKRCRPVFLQTVRQVPVTEKRLRPVVRSQITQVPVKQKVVKHFVEHRVKPYLGPCQHYDPPSCLPLPPTFPNVPCRR